MRTALVNASLIDGTGAAARRDATLVIDDSTIVEVSQQRDFGSEVQVVDLGGRTIMPGLIDCHIHLAHWGQRLLSNPEKSLMLLAAETVEALRVTLAAGCTTARDLGGLESGFREAINRGLIDGPRMQCSLVIVSPTNGIVDATDANGFESPVLPGMPRRYGNGPYELRGIIREVLHRGADVIKIASTGGVSSPRVDPRRQIFTREEVEAIVDEAHQAGVTVTCHAVGGPGVMMAVKAGVDCIEHGGWLEDEVIAEMLRRGTWYVPTFAVYRWHGTIGPEFKQIRTRAMWDSHDDSFRRARQAGVKIAMGTDIGGGYGYGDNGLELELLVEHGMTPLEAITTSTLRSAECLRVQSEVGTLVPDKQADLMILDGDPLADIGLIRRPQSRALVIKGGQAVAGTMLRTEWT